MEGKWNYAFIDGQNLHLWTTKEELPRKIDFRKFRNYLKEKYNITEAFFYLWYVKEDNNDFYTNLQKSGFIVVFKKHLAGMISEKKGNVDSDIIFNIMRCLIDRPNDFEKIVLVSGDGDYKNVVDYLIKKERFLKILFPNRKFASSLYKQLTARFFDYLWKIKSKIEYISR